MPWGKHFIIDANECQNDITNINIIKIFIDDLCDLGKMKKKGELIVEEFEDNQYNRERDLVGFSIIQIISLSNITLHINFISKTIYFDFFTCGDLNEEKVISLFQHYFNAKGIKKIYLKRDAIARELPFI